MDEIPSDRRLDATDLLYELGREIQAVAMMMRKHRVVDAQQLCECGWLPVRTLPMFGPRCEVASRQWAQAHDTMRRVVDLAGGRADGRVRATGRRL